MSEISSEAPGLYVHVPFCKTKCPYCGFYSVTDLGLVSQWLEAFCAETLLYGEMFGPFDSFYIGGGTPSLLDKKTLEGLFGAVRKGLEIVPHAEITVEVNPDDVTTEKLNLLRSLGVNRLSVGVQSFHEGELRSLGRRHTGEQAIHALVTAKASGFVNVGIDLMYGLPGQKESDWIRNMEQALRFEPSHLSCYQLTIEEATPFGRSVKEGSLKKIAEGREKRFFLRTSQFLAEKGFVHYEVSNFARTERVLSRHNLKYWNHVPYLGLGPGAHSFHKGVRWWNQRSVGGYCRALKEGGKPVEDMEALTAEQLRLERVLLGFRTRKGVTLRDLAVPDDKESAKALRRLQRSGTVRVSDLRVVPTLKGYLVADRLPLMFP
jgi:putative oxygen-independent coproporphyrinogen III oxidase